MNATNFPVWEHVADALIKVGAPTEMLLTKLRSRLESADPEFRLASAARILALTPGDAEAQSTLMNEIRIHSTNEWRAILALETAGTNALAAAPVILNVLDGTNLFSWGAVPRALEKIGASRDILLPRLREKLKAPDEQAREIAAAMILEIVPSDREAKAALVDLIKRNSKFQVWAINALGEAGPAAGEAVPIVRDALKSDNRRVRDAAGAALRKMQRERAAH